MCMVRERNSRGEQNFFHIHHQQLVNGHEYENKKNKKILIKKLRTAIFKNSKQRTIYANDNK